MPWLSGGLTSVLRGALDGTVLQALVLVALDDGHMRKTP